MTIYTVTDPQSGASVLASGSSFHQAALEGVAKLLSDRGVVAPTVRVSPVGKRDFAIISTIGSKPKAYASRANPRFTTASRRKPMPKRNPSRRTPVSKKCAIPKGKKHGDVFTNAGRRFQVISYMRDGKRIRFARKV